MKVIKVLLVAFSALILIGYFLINYGLEVATSETLRLVPSRAKEFGVDINHLDFDDAWISSYNAITWSGPRGSFNVSKDKVVDSAITFYLNISRITVSMSDLTNQFYTVYASGIQLDANAQSQKISSKNRKRFLQTELVDGDFKMEIAVDPFSPLRSLRPIMRELLMFVRHGETAANVKFTGVLKSNIRGREIRLGVFSNRDGNLSRLQVDRKDLANTASLLQLKLTEAELDILSQHPQKSPELLSIKNYAQTQARKIHQSDPAISEDAYRHILWSFLLSKEFGETFAQQVTDAHEQGATGNTEEERDQDYNNNAIGRKYARRGLSESDIADRMIQDPNVITEFGRGWR